MRRGENLDPEKWAWEMFATAHPVEAARYRPKAFVRLCQKKQRAAGMTKDQVWTEAEIMETINDIEEATRREENEKDRGNSREKGSRSTSKGGPGHC